MDMPASEKASRLYHSFHNRMQGNDAITHMQSKQFALVVCDEILGALADVGPSRYNIRRMKYYKDVKVHINNL